MISYNQVHQGTYLRIIEFAREFVKLGHRVTIIATSKNKKLKITEIEDQGVQIVTFPSLFKKGPRFGWDPYSIFLRLKWVKSKKFDIVHAFESRPTVIYPALFLKKRGIPLVLDWCDWFGKKGSVEERPNALLKFLFRPFETCYENNFRKNADFTTVVCETLYKRTKDLGVNPKTISIIPNGLNMPGWKILSKNAARDRFGYEDNDFIIGYIGSLFPKDAKLMTDSFELIVNDLPHAFLLHLGRSNYSPKTGMPNIKVTGAVDAQTLQIGLAACDICWLPLSDIPANWGRFPLKFSNYLSAGKPVLSTNVGDVPKYINTYDVGIVCSPTSKAISDAVIQLAKDPLTLMYYAKNSIQVTNIPKHTWKYLAIKLLNIYRHLSR